MATSAIPLFTLPTELMLMVVTNLGNGSYLAFSLTNRRMNEIFLARLYTRREDEVAATLARGPTTTTTDCTTNNITTTTTVATTVPNTTPTATTTMTTTTTTVTTVTTVTTTTTATTTTITTTDPADDLVRADLFNHRAPAPRLTNLHRALHYGLWHRRPRMIELAERFAGAGADAGAAVAVAGKGGGGGDVQSVPFSFSSSSPFSSLSPSVSSPSVSSFVVEGEWVEIPLILAAEANDAAFVGFLLARYAPRLRVALGSGRMLADVLLRAASASGLASARERGVHCYWPVLELLLWYVDERRPVRRRGRFEEDLLEKMLAWGTVQACGEHGCGAAGGGGVVGPGASCCFLWMMHLAVFKRMVRFVGVSKEDLEDWIARLPWHLQGEVYDLLVKVNGCPLLWEKTNNEE